MMQAKSDIVNKVIERILELSADIRRRGTAKDSPEFHNGKTLATLTALQEWEEFFEMVEELEGFPSAHPVC